MSLNQNQRRVSPFDFAKQINLGKRDIIRENPELETNYEPYIVNQAMSYHSDTVMFTNEMNLWWRLPKKLQFSFMLHAIDKRSRWAEWIKKEKSNEDVELLMKYYNCNAEVATEYLELLTRQDIDKLRKHYDEGGIKK